MVAQAVQCCGIEKGQDLLFGTAVIHWSKWNGKAVGLGVLNAGFYTPPPGWPVPTGGTPQPAGD